MRVRTGMGNEVLPELRSKDGRRKERTMRLIDADALKAEWQNGFYKKIVDALMDDAPTVDAVEVVRCKDCLRYYKGRNGWTCGLTGCTHNGEWYCADGEKGINVPSKSDGERREEMKDDNK